MREITTRPFGLCILGCLLLLCVSSCFLLPADGMVALEGVVVGREGEPLEDCTLKLCSEDKVRSAEVSGRFREDFVVAPRRKTYFVTLSCRGYLDYQSRPFEATGRPDDDPIQLGPIHLEPRGER